MIKAESITKSFGTLQVLKGIDFYANKGEIVSIVGPSGAGKTTLLQILGTLSRPDSGQILINNQETNQLDDTRLAAFRNQSIGFVFQFHHLLPEFTAIENVCIPAFIAKVGKKEAMSRAADLLDFLSLSERFHHKPSELSGGEKQRVAVARALMNSPEVIMADEPSGNLDSENQQELHELFLTLRKEMGQTFIIVTHDTGLAGMCDRIVQMKDGLVV
ncbi:MAG: ABC transporter ATP-binding protein [Bacteroidales bacterium]|nr:ABC transporter ATP-binding protein [Bacteroidales bacterium]